jgi:hypothetical protein
MIQPLGFLIILVALSSTSASARVTYTTTPVNGISAHIITVDLNAKKLKITPLGEDPAYTRWYREMLATAGPKNLPMAYADWELPQDSLVTWINTPIPLPPPGKA